MSNLMLSDWEDFLEEVTFTESFFLSIFFFLMWTTFKVFIEFVTILLLLLFFFCFVFWSQHMWDLSPQPGIESAPPTLEGKTLISGPPGKSPTLSLER